MPGLKFEAKPGQTILSEFTCGGLVKVQVKGTVEGLVTEPGYNTLSHSLTLALETTGSGTAANRCWKARSKPTKTAARSTRRPRKSEQPRSRSQKKEPKRNSSNSAEGAGCVR